jgi:hypothetical protein
MPSKSFEYQVAFSFLDPDEPLAKTLAERLRSGMKVFIYSERQLELAGKDGLETFAAVFRAGARVCVILHRTGWGQTKWTRVEETAIKERALESGWDFLLVVALDSSRPPVWLPSTKIWYGYERFGLEALAAVIDARVAEAGGETREETARERSARLETIEQAKEKRRILLRTELGVTLARQQLNELYGYIGEQVAAIQQEAPTLQINFRQRDRDVICVSTPGRSFTMGWSQQWGNSLDQASLFVRVIHGPYSLDGRTSEDNILEEVRIHFTIDDSDHPGWIIDQEPKRVYSSRTLAERFLNDIVDHAHDDPPRPRWLGRRKHSDEYDDVDL